MVSPPSFLLGQCIRGYKSRCSIKHALQKLPATQRAVMVLCDLEEMTAPEAAKMLGVNANVVKSRLHRARAALRRVIGKEFEALGVEVDGTHNFECTQPYLSTRA